VNGAHFDGRRFHNPAGPAGRGVLDLLKWAITRKQQPWPRWRENHYQPAIPASLPDGAIAATFINHASFLLQIAGLNLLIDPVYGERTSPVSFAGPRRVRPPGVPIEQLPRIDGVLVSHNHYDHCDLPTLRRLHARFDPWFITTLGNAKWFRRHGFNRVTELDWWQSHDLKPGLAVTVTPTQHFSGRTPFDRDATLWGGFYFTTPARRVYFLGDSGYCPHFREVRERLGAPDLALVPIGAYEPRWFMSKMHVNPPESVQAHLEIGSRLSVGMHFGTFRVTDEGIDEPAEGLRAELKKRGIPETEFIVPEFGETVVV
jgi:L-ascorbate metabolism protein UlaG (beta-lactamase superfamily)